MTFKITYSGGVMLIWGRGVPTPYAMSIPFTTLGFYSFRFKFEALLQRDFRQRILTRMMGERPK